MWIRWGRRCAAVKPSSALSNTATTPLLSKIWPQFASGCGVDPDVRNLWFLYKDAAASVSKTYAPNGTYALHKSRRGRCLAELTQVNAAPSRQIILPRLPALRIKEHVMMDVIMLAIGFGLFAVSVGYTIACDRL